MNIDQAVAMTMCWMLFGALGFISGLSGSKVAMAITVVLGTVVTFFAVRALA